MTYDINIVENILSEIFNVCNHPDSVSTMFSDDFKHINKTVLIHHVMQLTKEGYLSCKILMDETPLYDDPKLYDFNTNGLHPKGQQLLIKLQGLNERERKILQSKNPYESISIMVVIVNHLYRINKGV